MSYIANCSWSGKYQGDILPLEFADWLKSKYAAGLHQFRFNSARNVPGSLPDLLHSFSAPQEMGGWEPGSPGNLALSS